MPSLCQQYRGLRANARFVQKTEGYSTDCRDGVEVASLCCRIFAFLPFCQDNVLQASWAPVSEPVLHAEAGMAVHTRELRQPGRLRSFVRAVLTHRRLWLVAAVLAAVLTLPSLRVGLIFDDYHAKLLMEDSHSPARVLKSPLDMFRLLSGDPRQNVALRDYGFLPWWADEHIKGALWRPIASLTHWADYLLWPDMPALMHAQSILWYALLAAAAALLYRRLMGPTLAAGLAGLLYAADHVHSVPAGFLANRNVLLAGLFGVLCLLAHLRWRQDGWRPGQALAPALLAVSLLAKEEGIATCAYLMAFALVLDEGSWRVRLRTILPYIAVVAAWRACWWYQGYGVSVGGLYVDPLTEPLRYLGTLLHNAPILLLGQMGFPPADVSMILEGSTDRWFCIGAWLFGLLLAVVCWPLLRHDRVARFWAIGMVLALLPASTAIPSDRMLLFVGLGGIALVAQFLVWWFAADGRSYRWAWRASAAGLAGLFILFHMVVSPVDLLLRSAAPVGPKRFLERLYLPNPLDPSIERQDLVIVNPPAAFFLMASPLTWAAQSEPMPAHLRILCSSLFRPVDIHRPDERTLMVRPRIGYLFWKADRFWRSNERPIRLGYRVHLPGMTATVTAMEADGRPAEASFIFEVPLEDESLRWLQWKAGQFVPFTPPAVGHSATLTASWRDAFP